MCMVIIFWRFSSVILFVKTTGLILTNYFWCPKKAIELVMIFDDWPATFDKKYAKILPIKIIISFSFSPHSVNGTKNWMRPLSTRALRPDSYMVGFGPAVSVKASKFLRWRVFRYIFEVTRHSPFSTLCPYIVSWVPERDNQFLT
jgi:hypothetical protein